MFTFFLKWIGCQSLHIMFYDGEIPPVLVMIWDQGKSTVGNVTLLTPFQGDKPQFKMFSTASYALCLIVDPYARVMLTSKTSTSHLDDINALLWLKQRSQCEIQTWCAFQVAAQEISLEFLLYCQQLDGFKRLCTPVTNSISADSEHPGIHSPLH